MVVLWGLEGDKEREKREQRQTLNLTNYKEEGNEQ